MENANGTTLPSLRCVAIPAIPDPFRKYVRPIEPDRQRREIKLLFGYRYITTPLPLAAGIEKYSEARNPFLERLKRRVSRLTDVWPVEDARSRSCGYWNIAPTYFWFFPIGTAHTRLVEAGFDHEFESILLQEKNHRPCRFATSTPLSDAYFNVSNSKAT